MNDKKLAANRRNALKSTGPRTQTGKAKSSMNALKHGLRASMLAVPILEDPEEWEAHRASVVRDLGADGYLETNFAERIAALLWKLGRAGRYEAEMLSRSMLEITMGHVPSNEEVEKERAKKKAILQIKTLGPEAMIPSQDVRTILILAAGVICINLESTDQLAALGLPKDFNRIESWDRTHWTRSMLEETLQKMRNFPVPGIYDRNIWEDMLREIDIRIVDPEKVRQDRIKELERKREDALLPSDETMGKVSRYETGLERALYRTLHEFQRLQNAQRAKLEVTGTEKD